MKFTEEVLFPVKLLSLNNYINIKKEFLLIIQEEKALIMIFQSLDGENKMELNTGLLEIHGVPIGEKMEILDL